MAPMVYGLCAIAALACSILLFVASRRSHSGMLWWSGVCFLFLTLSNGVLVVVFVLPMLWPLRHGLSLAAVSALLYGLIFEER